MRGTWRGAPLLRIWKDMGRRAQRTGISLCGGPLGEPGRGDLSTRDLCKVLEMGISLHRGPVGTHVGGGGEVSVHREL